MFLTLNVNPPNVVLGTDSGIIEIQVEDRKIEFGAHSGCVSALCVIDTFLVSASGSELKLWPLNKVVEEGNDIQPVQTLSLDHNIVSLVSDNTSLFVVLEAEIIEYSVIDMKQIKKFSSNFGTSINACCLLDRRLIVAYSDFSMRIFTDNGEEDQVIQAMENIVSVAACSNLIYAGSDAGTFCCYDLSTNTFRSVIEVTNVPIQKLFVAGGSPFVSTVSSIYKVDPFSNTIERVYTEETHDIIDLVSSDDQVFLLTDAGYKKISLNGMSYILNLDSYLQIG